MSPRAERRNRPRAEIADDMRRVRAHQDQQTDGAQQARERRPAERATTIGTEAATTTLEALKIDPDPDPEGIPLPDEPADEGGLSAHGPRLSTRTSFADRLLTLSSLARLRAPTPLVDRLLYRGTLAQLSGPAGSYKSFLAIAVACSVAAGTDLDGQPAGQPEHVIYVAAEGAAGLRARILAWCEHHGVDPGVLDPTLHVLPVPVQLGHRTTDVAEAAALAEHLRAALVILDTRSKCTLGMEENSNTEQAKAVDAAEQICAGSGATVLAIHHTGRTGSTPRGATAWDGGVWSDLRIVRGKDLAVTVCCEKHKDAPSGCSHRYQLIEHQVSETAMPRQSENARSTLVCVSRMGETSASVNQSDILICDALRQRPGLTATQLIEAAKVPKATVHRRLKALVEAGTVVKSGNRHSLTSTAVAQWKVS